MKISSGVQAIFSKKYVRFDEWGRKDIKSKPFLRPAFEMAMKKYLKKREMDLRGSGK